MFFVKLEFGRFSRYIVCSNCRLSVAGKPKLAHLLKCFKDGSFSGIPYVAAADISSTTRKSWVYIVSAIALMVLVMTVCAIYCVLASSEGYGALWLGGKAPPF